MGKSPSPQITGILEAINQGNAEARKDLFAVVYDELRRMARFKMARETPGHTLQPTALVHEVYIRLMSTEENRWESRAHFFSAAAEAMRRILIEHVRKKMAQKRNRNQRKIDLDETMLAQEPRLDELFTLDAALTRLEQQDQQMSDVVKLRFYVGLTVQETAEALGTSPRSVDRLWAAARAWIVRELRKQNQ
jgi:RNA polymerase sigma factor (TIGR02999 family)